MIANFHSKFCLTVATHIRSLLQARPRSMAGCFETSLSMFQSYAPLEESSSSSYFSILVTAKSVQLPFTLERPMVPESSMNQRETIWGLVGVKLLSNFWQPRRKLRRNTG